MINARLRRSLLLVGVLLAPAAARIASIRDGGYVPTSIDAFGFASDALVSLLFASLVVLVGSSLRGLAIALAVGWGLLHYADYEHVRELEAGLQFTYAQYVVDPTFLFGSVLAPARPLLLASTTAATALLVWLSLAGEGGRALRFSLLAAALATAGLVAASALPAKLDALEWRQRHFLHANLERALRARGLPQPDSGRELAAFRRDLSGRPRIELPRPDTDVLLVVLEGVPGPYVASIAEAADLAPEVGMKELSDFARQSLTFTSFVVHQRQTNRGLYAILCGDYPKLASPTSRMTDYRREDGPACLPEILAGAGYTTVYLQGAPLGFMLKDQFMANIGFEQVLGDRSFEDPQTRSYWGVDDRTLLEDARARIRSLREGHRPWFLTLLTVGTHQPYTLPDGTRQALGAESRYTAAVAYLDVAFGEFVRGLALDGVLDETLVIVTSDESRGVRAGVDDLSRTLSQSWAPLLVSTPERKHALVHEPFGQIDLSLSVLDYLGLDAGPTEFIGRSVFRRYGAPRTLFFANTYLRGVGAAVGRRILYSCDEGGGCIKREVDSQSLFGRLRRQVPFSPDEFDERHAVVAHTLRERGIGSELKAYTLLSRSVVPVTRAERMVFDGQDLLVAPRSRIEVEIELRVAGSEGQVKINQGLRGPGAWYFKPELPWVKTGETLAIHYAYDTFEELKRLKCVLEVKGGMRVPKGLEVHVETATLRVGPIPEASEAQESGPAGSVRVEVTGS